MINNEEKTSLKELLEKGLKLSEQGLYKEEIKVYKTALIMAKDINKTNLASIYIKLANAYYKLNDADKYTYYYELYLNEYPDGQSSIFSRLAHAYYYFDTDKSIDYHNKSLSLKINKYDSESKIFAMTKSAFYDQRDIKDEAEYEAEQIRNAFFKDVKKYNHDDKKPNKNKKLNIGYLSSDCYTHTMMNYMLPVWENHNKDEFNFFIFSGNDKNDSMTQKIKKTAFEFIDCSKMDLKTLAQTIYDKKIDILVDLGGYTHIKTYISFYKPAPVIISYLGYLNTMGIKEVDYIFADKFTIPEDTVCLYTEKPLYIDNGYRIFHPNNFTAVEDSPYKKNNYVTFGSFNCTSKLNDFVFYMWVKILRNYAGSKLLIYRTQMTKSIIRYLKSKFEKLGIEQERLIFSTQKFSPHYKAYSLCDIALDPYPFSGMSIAIEAALMGVPTVTLLGAGMQSRGAGGINELTNLNELNAVSGDEYVDIAVKLADDKNKLQQLRKSLRGRILESPLCSSHVDFVRNLESKYKQAWETFTNS